MRNNLRYLFASPLMQEYWGATHSQRARFLVPGTPEFLFNEIANEVFLEHAGSVAKAWKPSAPLPEQEAA